MKEREASREGRKGRGRKEGRKGRKDFCNTVNELYHSIIIRQKYSIYFTKQGKGLLLVVLVLGKF